MTEKRAASIPKDGLENKSKASKDEIKFIKFKQDLINSIQALTKSALNTIYHTQNAQIISENGILTENMNKLLYIQISNYIEEINMLKKKVKLMEKAKSTNEDMTKLNLQVSKLQTEIAYYKNMIITLEKDVAEKAKREEKLKIENESLRKHIIFLTLSHNNLQVSVPNNGTSITTPAEVKKINLVKPNRDLKQLREKSVENPKPYLNRTFQEFNEDKNRKTVTSKLRTTAVSRNMNNNSESMEGKISEDENQNESVAVEEAKENGIKTSNNICSTPKQLVNSKLASVKKLRHKIHTKTYCNIKELTIEDSECDTKKKTTSSVKNTFKKEIKSLKTFNTVQKSIDDTAAQGNSSVKKPKLDPKKIKLNSTTNKNGASNPFKYDKYPRSQITTIISPINPQSKGSTGANDSQSFSLYNVLEEKSRDEPIADKNIDQIKESMSLSIVESELEALQKMEQDIIDLQEKYVNFYEEKTSILKHNYDQTFIIEYQEKRHQPCS